MNKLVELINKTMWEKKGKGLEPIIEVSGILFRRNKESIETEFEMIEYNEDKDSYWIGKKS